MDRIELAIVNTIKDAIIINDLYTTVEYTNDIECSEVNDYETYVFNCIHNEMDIITNIFK